LTQKDKDLVFFMGEINQQAAGLHTGTNNNVSEQSEKIRGILFVLAAGICWGSIGPFIRTFNKAGLYSLDIVVLRSISTTIFLFLFLLVYDRRLLKIRLRDIWCFIGTGIVSMAFFNFCYFSLITISTLSVAAVMLYTAPVFVMILSAILFRERMTKNKAAALLLTVLGCIFVTGVIGDAASLSLRAILLGLGAGLGYALYSIFSRFALRKGCHSFTISFYTFLFASIATIPMADFRKIAAVGTSSLFMLLFCLFSGFVTTALPYILYNFGLAGMENGQAAIIASIEPVVATLLGFFAFHERLTGGNLIGIVLVLAAIVLSNLSGE
jgi:drug/metabolite transporter (DMT)-like permease